MCLLLSDTLNSSLIKQKFIAKQTEKSQRMASVQNRAATVEPPIKKNCKLRSRTVPKSLNEEQEKEFSNHEKSTHKEIITTVLGSTKGQESVFPPKPPSSHAPSLPSNTGKCKIFFYCKS